MMTLFHCVKTSQGVCCLVVLCFVLATTELRGSLVYRDEQNRAMLTQQLKSRGGTCEQLLLYLPAQQQQRYLARSSTTNNRSSERAPRVSKLSSAEGVGQNDDDKQKPNEDDDDASGRVVLVFDGSSVRANGQMNTTDELRLRAYLLFEWSSAQNEPNLPTNDAFPANAVIVSSSTNNGTGGGWPQSASNNTTINSSSLLLTNSTARIAEEDGNNEEDGQHEGGGHSDEMGTGGGLLPEGEYAFKINKLEGGMKNVRQSPLDIDDPFDGVAGRLFLFAITSSLQVIYTIAHSALNNGNSKSTNSRTTDGKTKKFLNGFSTCEIFFLLVGMVVCVLMLIFAAETCASWDQRWQCTNFRPHLPVIFPLTLILAIILLILFVLEAFICLSEAVDGHKTGLAANYRRRLYPMKKLENNEEENFVISARKDPPRPSLIPPLGN